MAPVLIAFGVFVFAAGLVIALYYAATKLPALLVQRRVGFAHGRRDQAPDAGARPRLRLVKRQKDGADAHHRRAVGRNRRRHLARQTDRPGRQQGGRRARCCCRRSRWRRGGVHRQRVLRDVDRPGARLPRRRVGAHSDADAEAHRRMRRFEEQFPEALDLLSRAIKAGHAFQTAMGMVADEGADPMGPEFRKTFEEQNYGLALKDALDNLGDPDAAHRRALLRDRRSHPAGDGRQPLGDPGQPRLRRARAVQDSPPGARAHGPWTHDGLRAAGLPASLAVALSFINPEHMNMLFTEHAGAR